MPDLRRTSSIRFLLAMFVASFVGHVTGLRAQCTPQWQAGDPLAVCRGLVAGMVLWDPDGGGPLASVLVTVGSTGGYTDYQPRVRTFDGTSWTTLGSLPGSSAECAVVWNGQLVVASDTGVYAWTGSTWQVLGLGSTVRSMVVWNGDLYVGGTFTTFGGVAASRVARWNGSIWSPLGVGIGTGGSVRALAVFQGVLFVGGQFTAAGGVAAGNLAVWNGSAWAPIAAANGEVTALAARIGTSIVNSWLFAAGTFTTIGGTAANHVARFNPTTNTWTALGAGMPGTGCDALFVRATGLTSYELTAIDDDTLTGQMYRWDAGTSTWVSIGAPSSGPSAKLRCIGLWAGGYVLGAFTSNEVAVHRLVGSAWQSLLGSGIAGTVYAVLADGSETILGGDFVTISGAVRNGIARGTPGNWSPLGSGVNGSVTALARMPNGDVIAGGSFTTAGGQPASRIARWNGSSWSPLGSGTSGQVLALAVLPNGDLVAAGAFASAGGGFVNNIARWDGTNWNSLGVGCNGVVWSLLARANGDLIAGGAFTNQSQRIARWNGTTWSPLGTGSSQSVWALAELVGGDIVATGAFAGVAGPLARWNGTAWTAVASGALPLGVVPNALGVLPDGDVVAGGGVSGSGSIDTMWRLDGGVWQPLGNPGQAVLALAIPGDGTVRVGGDFDGEGSAGAARFAVLATPCPASALPAAAGCASSGGSNTLAATTLPWANGTLRTRGTGLPATAIVLVLTSVTSVVPGVPLSLLLPQGVPGCSLHVAPDILQAVVTTTGTADSELQLPNVPPIVGVTFYQQMLPIELDALGNWVAITATNALQLTGGVF